MLRKCTTAFLVLLFYFPTPELSAQTEYALAGPGFRVPTDPFISILYGQSDLSLRKFEYPVAEPQLLELELGLESRQYKENDDRIIDLMKRYISISNISTDIGGGVDTDQFGSDVWRVGIVSENGYGYSLSSIRSEPALILSHSNGLTWSNIDFKAPDILLPDDLPIFRFDNATRFGGMTEAEIMLQFSSHTAVALSFERSIIYERHLFWKWLGSIAVEGAAQGLIDEFVDRIFESSPGAGPVVNFFLKNGLAYGIYELRKAKMNWPFETAAPLQYDTFKIGVTFNF